MRINDVFEDIENDVRVVVLKEDIRCLEEGQFSGNEKITTLILNENLEKMEELCFCGACNLVQVIYPGSRYDFVKIKGWNLALLWTACQTVQCADGNVFVEKALIQGRKLISVSKVFCDVEIDINSYDSIAPAAFWCSKIREIRISPTVSYIPERCFAMSMLEKIYIPSSVKLICKAAFESSCLSEIFYEKNAKPFFEREAVHDCPELKEIIIPGQFDLGCVSDCKNLEKISFLSIPEKFPSFIYNCSSLRRIDFLRLSEAGFFKLSNIQNALSCIPDQAVFYFKDGSSVKNSDYFVSAGKLNFVNKYLKEFKVDSVKAGISEIDGMAFNHNEYIEKIVIPSTVTKIPYGAFAGCIKLNYLLLPCGIKSLGSEIFYNNTALFEINFSGTVEAWEKILKEPDWANDSCIAHVHCIDGEVSVNAESSVDLNSYDVE